MRFGSGARVSPSLAHSPKLVTVAAAPPTVASRGDFASINKDRIIQHPINGRKRWRIITTTKNETRTRSMVDLRGGNVGVLQDDGNVNGARGVGQDDNAQEEEQGEEAGDDQYISVSTLERTVAVLEAGRRMGTFVVDLRQRERRAAATTTTPPPPARATCATTFGRFVERLGDPSGRAVVVDVLIHRGFRFVTDPGFRTEDLRTLFGQALPKKQGLLYLYFEDCEMDASMIRLLEPPRTTTPLATTAPVVPTLGLLTFRNTQLDLDGVHAIVGLMTLRDSAMTHFDLDLRGMGPEACQLVCGRLPRCTNLEDLHLRVDEVSGNMLDHVAATSSLKDLVIDAVWTPEAFRSFATQLRTNTSMVGFLLLGDIDRFGLMSDDIAAQVEETLQSYNCTPVELLFEERWGGGHVTDRQPPSAQRPNPKLSRDVAAPVS